MAPAALPLVFDRDFKAAVGVLEPVASGIARVTAPNASAYTFTGTNSFLVGRDRLLIVDPGPNDPVHLAALDRAVGGRRVEAIVLTHTHKDHSALAAAAGRRFAAPLWFAGRHRRSRPRKFLEIDPLARAATWDLVPDRVLRDGEMLALGDMRLKVVTTPGHCANHIALAVEGTPYLMSGDHVMGWNSTLVAVPDGSMRDYLASLDKLAALPQTVYLPAHGGPVQDGVRQARALAWHRNERNAQILARLDEGPQTVRALLDAIYPGVPGRNRFAARLTLLAHIEFLAESGQLKPGLSRFGGAIRRA